MDGPPSIEGLPVVAADGKLVGVLSRKDFAKGGTHVKVRTGLQHILLLITGGQAGRLAALAAAVGKSPGTGLVLIKRP
jgi:hypothetical protein